MYSNNLKGFHDIYGRTYQSFYQKVTFISKEEQSISHFIQTRRTDGATHCTTFFFLLKFF